jgi:hypothetical protein
MSKQTKQTKQNLLPVLEGSLLNTTLAVPKIYAVLALGCVDCDAMDGCHLTNTKSSLLLTRNIYLL